MVAADILFVGVMNDGWKTITAAALSKKIRIESCRFGPSELTIQVLLEDYELAPCMFSIAEVDSLFERLSEQNNLNTSTFMAPQPTFQFQYPFR